MQLQVKAENDLNLKYFDYTFNISYKLSVPGPVFAPFPAFRGGENDGKAPLYS